MALYGKMPSVTYQDYPEAALIVLWGVNPSASGIHLVPVRARGAEARRQAGRRRSADDAARAIGRRAPGRSSRAPTSPSRWPSTATCSTNGYADEAFLREHTHGRRAAARARRASGRSSRPRDVAGIDAAALERVARAVRRQLAGAHPLRLGPRAQPQRRQRGDGGAGAAGGRRQVRRARRRLLDEQLGVVEHRAALDRRAGARHPPRQHEPSRARAHRVRRSAGQRAVRLQLQSGGDGARPAPRPPRPRARGPLHRRLRAGDDRHGALRRRRPAGDDVPRGLRLRAAPTGRSTSSWRCRSSTPSANRDRTPTCSASSARGSDVLDDGEPTGELDLLRRACSMRCPARSATTSAPARAPAPPFGVAPIQFVDVFPEHAGPEGRSLPGGARGERAGWACTVISPIRRPIAIRWR